MTRTIELRPHRHTPVLLVTENDTTIPFVGKPAELRALLTNDGSLTERSDDLYVLGIFVGVERSDLIAALKG